jgi:hypothetical protein
LLAEAAGLAATGLEDSFLGDFTSGDWGLPFTGGCLAVAADFFGATAAFLGAGAGFLAGLAEGLEAAFFTTDFLTGALGLAAFAGFEGFLAVVFAGFLAMAGREKRLHTEADTIST